MDRSEDKKPDIGSELFSEIASGKIRSWPQLEIESQLYGMDIDGNFVKYLLKFPGYPGSNANTFRLVEKTLKECDMIDHYFEDPNVVDHVVFNDGKYVGFYKDDNEQLAECIFDGYGAIKKLDIRNPKYLLNYLMNLEINTHKILYYDNLMKVFELILKRCEIRINYFENHGNNNMVLKFKTFIERLNSKKDELFNLRRNVN